MEFLLYFLRHVQRLDEGLDALLRDGRVLTRQRLEGLVGLGAPFPAQDGLDAFGHNGPIGIEVRWTAVFNNNLPNPFCNDCNATKL